MDDFIAIAFYLTLMLLIWGFYGWRRGRRTRLNQAKLDAAKAAGLSEPASLHPLIDHALCIGCGACIEACPEKKVLGLIRGKAELINPAACIGHGVCKSVCPANGITLVFGTEKRGMDIPLVQSNFETNVPGIFIAGELGGMGLIRNASEQGKQAVQAISKLSAIGEGEQLDLLIIGAGPAGIAAALTAQAEGLRYQVVEQESLGGTVFQYPRGKLVMTAPVELPLAGKIQLKETSKEALLELWQGIVEQHQLRINFHERMEQLQNHGDRFTITTNKGEYRSRAVLLAIGRRGTPRKLGVPGEQLPKVVYRLLDPEQYQQQHVLVVGGGDSALEAACSIAEQPGTTVTLSYRSDGFSRAKQKNRDWVDSCVAEGKLQLMLSSKVKQITPQEVNIEQNQQIHILKNDAVLVCAGGILPSGFLKEIGISVETKYGSA